MGCCFSKKHQNMLKKLTNSHQSENISKEIFDAAESLSSIKVGKHAVGAESSVPNSEMDFELV